ncbi:hypothetical protein ACFRH9_21720 [Peribacillus butanolivorans]|uniref:hypothetical protein n=1 Tax=Peribacillus butanolivorans TaxID=421767 RepID=UPI00366C6625
MFKNLKILGVALTASVGLFVLPANSSAATLASYTSTVSNAGEMTGAYNSDGGTYKVCVSNIRAGNTFRVQLFELDSVLNEIGSDKYISAPSGCATWTGISTDGDNGKAELNAKLNSTTGDDTVSIQLID